MGQSQVRFFKVAVVQAEAWWADVDGGHRLSASSLSDLRRSVVRTLDALHGPYLDPVEIEWTYTLADGAFRAERQILSPTDLRPKDTTSRVGWHQPHVDEYIERRFRRRPGRTADPEA